MKDNLKYDLYFNERDARECGAVNATINDRIRVIYTRASPEGTTRQGADDEYRGTHYGSDLSRFSRTRGMRA